VRKLWAIFVISAFLLGMLSGAQAAGLTFGREKLKGQTTDQGNFSLDTRKDLEKLTATHKCPGCHLSGVDLSGAQLQGADLTGADLSGANLSRADLRGAQLQEANLKSADLSGANLNGVQLSGTTWMDGGKCKAGSIGECKK
jgi:uncharacterized protein YjbI with pentapeptide repeats